MNQYFYTIQLHKIKYTVVQRCSVGWRRLGQKSRSIAWKRCRTEKILTVTVDFQMQLGEVRIESQFMSKNGSSQSYQNRVYCNDIYIHTIRECKHHNTVAGRAKGFSEKESGLKLLMQELFTLTQCRRKVKSSLGCPA